MLNLLENKSEIKSPNHQHNLDLKSIKKLYIPKHTNNFIGLEYERLSLDKKTLNTASYNSVSKVIETYAKDNNWEIVYDDKTIIGAKSQNNTSISLEPGNQLEISISPKESIIDIDLELNKIIYQLDEIAQKNNVLFLGYGINPIDSVENIPLLNKKRYLIMDKYLPKQKSGLLAQYMMRKTAGIQINVDFRNPNDAFYKLKFFNLIMPFIEGLCSNSPLENNILHETKSQRANVWRNVGKDRCNFFYKKIFQNSIIDKISKKDVIDKYIIELLKVPMIYVERNGVNTIIDGQINFNQFISSGYKDLKPQIQDYELHQSLCFPDVRLKNYIEIRNHDSSNPKIALGLCALYKGLMSCDFKELLNEFSELDIQDIDNYNTNSILYGIDYKINNKTSAVDILNKIFEISKNNLSSFDKLYLGPLCYMLSNKKTNADLIIEYDIRNVNDLIEFLT